MKIRNLIKSLCSAASCIVSMRWHPRLTIYKQIQRNVFTHDQITLILKVFIIIMDEVCQRKT